MEPAAAPQTIFGREDSVVVAGEEDMEDIALLVDALKTCKLRPEERRESAGLPLAALMDPSCSLRDGEPMTLQEMYVEKTHGTESNLTVPSSKAGDHTSCTNRLGDRPRKKKPTCFFTVSPSRLAELLPDKRHQPSH